MTKLMKKVSPRSLETPTRRDSVRRSQEKGCASNTSPLAIFSPLSWLFFLIDSTKRKVEDWPVGSRFKIDRR